MASAAGSRVVGLDVARCLALLGMVATHVRTVGDPLHDVAAGRASALFAVLAGVSLALMTGGPTPVTGRERAARTLGLVVRAVLIAVVGLALGAADSGLAVILTYYGVLFCLGALFVGLRAGPLLALAAAWVVLGPVLSHVVRPRLPERGYESPRFEHLADPGQLASELLLTGYYPVLPWLAYLLVGMALGRADLRVRRTQLLLVGAGLVLASAAPLLSDALAPTDLAAQADQGLYGTTPTGSWEWLLVDGPHSGTPLDLARTIGSALLVIGVGLLVVESLRGTARTAVRVLFGAGTMTLTLYSLHVLLRTDDLWPPDEPDDLLRHWLVLLAVGSAYAAVRRRGPLEQLVGLCSDAAARVVRR